MGEAIADTLPKLLAERARDDAGRTAIREKGYGIWQSWTWREVAANVRDMALGLRDLGLRRGAMVAIIGDNRPHLYWAMAAAQSMGAVPVPLFQDAVAEEMHYVLDHAEARFAVVENQEQVDKVMSIKDRCPNLEYIVYTDPKGLRHYDFPFLFGVEELMARGAALSGHEPGLYEAEVAKGAGSDLAVILYTSGTTGRPKGVMLSFDNIIVSARNANRLEAIRRDEEVLAYLPMAWVGDHIFSYGQALVAGFTVSCPESADTVMIDLRELGPTFFFAPPAIFENILTQVTIRMEDAGWFKRKMYHYFMGVARRSGSKILEGRPVPLWDRVRYALGQALVYGPLRNVLGFSRLRRVYTAGEAIGPEIFDFYRSLGINMKQLYGQTEASVYVTVQPDNAIKLDSVGVPALECEVEVSDEGEVLYRSPGVFMGYYKNPEATAETKTEDGWVRTGDAGLIDDDGHLRIIDRAKDVGRLKDGTLFAPKYLENKLKFFPCIKEAVCLGDRRDYAAAMVNIDLDAVGSWAERRGLAYTSYTDLAARPEVYDLVEESVEAVNASLGADPALAGSRIRRFLILHKELDADDGELTRTRKVRRRIVAERYENLIDALYSDADQVAVEARVTFEDGREGVIKADLQLRDVAAGEGESLRRAG